jgi:O-antigen/teichoic acid export membrane protein
MKSLSCIVTGFIDWAKKNSFLKSVFTLSSGVVIAQGINFFGMALIGRIYTPATMGDYTLITSNANVISTVACLGMMTALMLPQDDEEARGLCQLVTKSILLLTTIIVGGLWLLRDSYRIFNTEEVHYGLALIVLWLYVVSYMLNNICYAHVNRLKMYRVMFWNPVIGAGCTIGFAILFGLLNWGFVGYTAAHILAFAVNIIHLTIHANPFVKIGNKDFGPVPLLKSYRRFPIFQLPANLIASLGNQIPVWLMERVFGAAPLGYYSMTLRILGLPSFFLATPVNRVYFQEASQRYNRGEDIGEFSFKILETNIKVAIIPISLLMIFGRQLFSLFLGKQWGMSGEYAAILGIYQLMLFCGGCLSGYFVIIRKNSWNLLTSSVTLLISITLYIVCRYLVDMPVITYLVILSVTMSVKTAADLGIFFAMLKFNMLRYVKFLFLYIVVPAIVSMVIHHVLFGGFFA